MSEDGRSPKESPDFHQKPSFHLFHLPHWLTAIVLIIVIVYNLGEFFKTSGIEELASDKSIFSIPTEIFDRMHSCDYKLLFFCELKSNSVPEACKDKTGLARSTCILTDNGKFENRSDSPSGWASIPYLRLPIAAVQMLTRLPDAAIHMLGQRWGHHLAFSLGLFFVAGYVTLMAVALRQEKPANLWLFAVVIVIGPYLMLGIFWVLQHALAGTSAFVDKMAGLLIAAIGLPGCLLVCLQHDAESLLKGAKLIK